ncbi:MAG: DUF1150 family protein [Brevirhabdus sp.]
MNTPIDFSDDTETEERIVYVRAVKVADLPEEVQNEAGGLKQLYAVHDQAGERLALVRDRHLAFVLARQNDMSPVTVH